jgi:hypothetical protein
MNSPHPHDPEFEEVLSALRKGNDALESELNALTTEREAVFKDMETEFAAAEKAMTNIADWLEKNAGSGE